MSLWKHTRLEYKLISSDEGETAHKNEREQKKNAADDSWRRHNLYNDEKLRKIMHAHFIYEHIFKQEHTKNVPDSISWAVLLVPYPQLCVPHFVYCFIAMKNTLLISFIQSREIRMRAKIQRVDLLLTVRAFSIVTIMQFRMNDAKRMLISISLIFFHVKMMTKKKIYL